MKVNYGGAVILLACLIGGGTDQGLWSDHAIQLAMIPACLIGFLRIWDNHLVKGGKALALAIIAFLFLQFLPYAPTRPLPPILPEINAFPLWTISPSRSLQSAFFAYSVLGFALFVATFTQDEQKKLVRFIFLGLVINMVVGIIQLSYSGATRSEGLLPFVITSGLFANENHLSALVFMAVPLIAWRLLSVERKPALYLLVTSGIVAFLFAVGSRAGMSISAGLALFCLFWFMSSGQSALIRIGVMLVAIAVYILALLKLGMDNELAEDLRQIFFSNTLRAIADHWVAGTGLGTFVIVYPQYEPLSDVFWAYANHAHNDYLELFLEGGVLAIILVVGFFILISVNLFSSPLSQAAFLSIIAILAHSLIDYPLRTMGVATQFALLSVFVLAKPNEKSGAPNR